MFVPIAWIALISVLMQPGAQDETPSFDQKKPRILLSDTALDFGTLRQLETRTRSLSLLNDGEAELRILDIETDCTCTPVDDTGKILKPGEAGEISITFEAELEPGLRKGHFIIHSNDPGRPEIKIKVCAHVQPEYDFEPYILNFGISRRGDPEKELLLEITPVAADGLVLKSARSDCENISVACESAVHEEGKPVILKVRLHEGMKPGRFKHQLIIETDNPRIATWKIPMIGVVQGGVSVYPTLVTFGTVKSGQTCRRIVGIEMESEELLSIPEILCPLGFIQTEIKTVLKDKKYEIVLTLSPETPAGMIDTEITIKTSAPDMPTIPVRLFGVVHDSE